MSFPFPTVFLFFVLQLRAVRAFKSTLDEMEERRSIHSLRTSRSNPGAKPLYDITYIDEESSGPPPQPTTKRSSASVTSDQSKNADGESAADASQVERSRSAPSSNNQSGNG